MGSSSKGERVGIKKTVKMKSKKNFEQKELLTKAHTAELQHHRVIEY